MLPSGMTNDAWDSRLWSFCAFSRVCVVVLNHSWIATMYLVHFAGVRATVLFLISHMKPMITSDEENRVSLEGSQGIPS